MKRITTKLESKLFSITVTIDSAGTDDEIGEPLHPPESESVLPTIDTKNIQRLGKATKKYARKIVQIVTDR